NRGLGALGRAGEARRGAARGTRARSDHPRHPPARRREGRRGAAALRVRRADPPRFPRHLSLPVDHDGARGTDRRGARTAPEVRPRGEGEGGAEGGGFVPPGRAVGSASALPPAACGAGDDRPPREPAPSRSPAASAAPTPSRAGAGPSRPTFVDVTAESG